MPSVFNRAMLLRVTPKTVVKLPPMRIFPSGCTAVADNIAADGAEIERLVEPAVGFQPGDVVARLSADAVRSKSPPAKILPSACTAIE